MRELIEISKKEKKARFSVLCDLVKDEKKLISNELKNYKKLASGIKKARISLEVSERAYERRETKRKAMKIRSAIADRDTFSEELNLSSANLAKLLGDVRRNYLAMSGLFYGCRAVKIMDKCENYIDSVVWSMISTQLRFGINDNIELEEY